jgi:uncharacterized protein YutD
MNSGINHIKNYIRNICKKYCLYHLLKIVQPLKGLLFGVTLHHS